MPFAGICRKHGLREGHLELFADGKVGNVPVGDNPDGVDGRLSPVSIGKRAWSFSRKHLFLVGKSKREELYVSVGLDGLAIAVEDSDPSGERVVSGVDSWNSAFPCVGSIGLLACVAESQGAEDTSLQRRMKEWSRRPSLAWALNFAHDGRLGWSIGELLCRAFICNVEQSVVQSGLNESCAAGFLDQRYSALCDAVGVMRIRSV
jgi:hypothetical protein